MPIGSTTASRWSASITSGSRLRTTGTDLYKDTKRIAPYVPSFAAEFAKRDWSEDRIYRRDGIGAKLLDSENLQAELTGRNYSDESIGKILGGNMMRVLRRVLR